MNPGQSIDPAKLAAEWRVVPFNDRYEISEYGHLRVIKGKRKGLVVTPKITAFGYVIYRLSRNGKDTWHFAHRIVALAFIGPRPDGMEIAHFNGVKTDNHFSNIRWATKKENAADRKRHGTDPIRTGTNNPACRLSPDQVLEIREIYSRGGISFKKLGAKYGICAQHAHEIVRKKTWTCLEA